MASSDNLASMEPWTFRPAFADSWISEAFARDTETLTKALQKSLSNNVSAAEDGGGAAAISSFFNPPPEIPMAIMAQFNGGGSGSDPETPASAKRRISIPVNGGGKAGAKRKSRASKRTTTTTFITADPANFRQMVQQVTGVRFPGGNSQVPAPVLLKPEPQRPSVNRALQGQGCLPTLDTSAFLLDHHHIHRQQVLPPSAAASVAQPPLAAAASTPDFADFDSFSSFPTLESRVSERGRPFFKSFISENGAATQIVSSRRME
ncbi:hypothetical protein RHGRI_006624 [Rhododendron griersonianum]|uniref:VQ domain-containing protein n=1 Tax=Rhododendron griersonianum TaxID=479676 RepID=A0AAV6KUB3_9ERIC|nr:hypothetical protein RHGRI_006624 [Rhododendron griersonianum]